MKGSPRPSRSTSNLSEPLRQRLNAYALAAGATGASMLALSPPVDAKIVYTPAHVKITPNQQVPLDLNHDGITDFTFSDTFSTTSAGFYREGVLSILPSQTNEIWGHVNGIGGHYASALVAGVHVGPKGKFSAGSRSLAYGGQEGTSVFCEGKWSDVKNRYLGLKFMIHGKAHFGWARLNVTCNVADQGRTDAFLTGYAYETVPSKPIVTGKTRGPSRSSADQGVSLSTPLARPATLSLLAIGSPGLSIWRREEQPVTAP
jgi:hypothetical protein